MGRGLAACAQRVRMIHRPFHQDLHYDHRRTPSFQSKVVGLAKSRLEQLGGGGISAEHWRSSRNADLYLLKSDETEWLLKILVSKPSATIRTEFRHLQDLWALGQGEGSFRVPKPEFFIADRSAYVMEMVDGQRLDSFLYAKDTRPDQAVDLIRRCGQALAEIHRAWLHPTDEAAKAKLLEGLGSLPWRLRSRQKALLQAALAQLRGTDFATSTLYLDFDPVNLLLSDTGQLILLDPPEQSSVGFVEWDIATFLFGIRRAWWRKPIAAPRVLGYHAKLSTAFLEAYAGLAPWVGVNDRGRSLLRTLAELGRVGQFWKWWLRPFQFRHRLEGILRAGYAYPLLVHERRRCFRDLGRLVR